MLIRIIYLNGEDIHRGASLALSRFAIDQRHHTCECITRVDWRKILVFFFTVQDAHQVNAKTGNLADHFSIAPQCECGWCGRVEWYIGLAGTFSLFPALVNGL